MCDNQLKEIQRQTFLRLITCKIQKNFQSTLKIQNENLKQTLKNTKKILDSSEMKQKEYFEKLQLKENQDFQRRQLQVLLHYLQVKLNFALNKQKQSREIVKKLRKILNDITFTVSSGLKVLQIKIKFLLLIIY